MPSGGRRAGAGRKPGAKRAVVLGMDGTRRDVLPSAPPIASGGPLIEPPTDFDADRAACWRAWAPWAVQERTLTPSKVAGFRKFCDRWVTCAALQKRIQELGGPAMHEADGLLRRLEKWEQLLDASLGNFRLRSFGKPEAPERPKASAPNPWAQVAGGGK